jgi:hypothetical protein
MKAKRARAGDVLEVEVPEGRIYLHFVGTHPDYGDGVAVSPTTQPNPVAVAEDLFRDGYFTFYPARAAVSQGLARVVGRLPSQGIPRRLRRRGAMIGTEVKTWIIEDGSREEVKHKLSKDELRLPIAATWNHALLLERVRMGWRPEGEGRVDDA